LKFSARGTYEAPRIKNHKEEEKSPKARKAACDIRLTKEEKNGPRAQREKKCSDARLSRNRAHEGKETKNNKRKREKVFRRLLQWGANMIRDGGRNGPLGSRRAMGHQEE